MVLFLTVPSTVGLALLGVPIIRLIYEHGRFSPHATLETARALSGYAIGLVAYAAIKVVAPAFYALGRTRVPLIASVSAVAANLIWNIADVPPLRPRRAGGRDVDRRAGERRPCWSFAFQTQIRGFCHARAAGRRSRRSSSPRS